LSIIFNAEDINNLKKSGRFKAKDLEKIELLEKIKAYSVKDLGFKPSKSYCKFYDQKNRSLIWIVTACAPFKLEAYEWDFPLLGGLSYKGFFDSLKAVQESAKLKKMGFDSDISAVQAWSTLGYLNDPLFSEMLKKSKGEFVELILHELFHGTIYAPGSVDLNENLAEFVAKNATLDFLKNDTSELRLYLMKKELEQKIDLLMLECIATLKSEYVKISPQTSLEDKKIIKKSALEKEIDIIN
ncbi:MAG: aminopeptidase, partial [Bacteroidota bacterium]